MPISIPSKIKCGIHHYIYLKNRFDQTFRKKYLQVICTLRYYRKKNVTWLDNHYYGLWYNQCYLVTKISLYVAFVPWFNNNSFRYITMQQIETKNSHDYSQSIIKQVIYFAQILVNTRYIKCDECLIRKNIQK